MKKLITTIALFASMQCYAQSPVMDINYYNSLRWKTPQSMQVYIDCTRTQPVKPKRIKYIYVYDFTPHRNLGPVFYPLAYRPMYFFPAQRIRKQHCK
jgi:hypothetical protein